MGFVKTMNKVSGAIDRILTVILCISTFGILYFVKAFITVCVADAIEMTKE